MSKECPRSCEAPAHSKGCPCIGCNRTNDGCKNGTSDHFTPQSIQKLVHVKDTPQNHQWLSPPCHRDKDRDTPLRGDVIRLEKRGVVFTWEQHQAIFNGGENPRTLMRTPQIEPITPQVTILPGEYFQNKPHGRRRGKR
jgi:hypothetical protein